MFDAVSVLCLTLPSWALRWKKVRLTGQGSFRTFGRFQWISWRNLGSLPPTKIGNRSRKELDFSILTSEKCELLRIFFQQKKHMVGIFNNTTNCGDNACAVGETSTSCVITTSCVCLVALKMCCDEQIKGCCTDRLRGINIGILERDRWEARCEGVEVLCEGAGGWRRTLCSTTVAEPRYTHAQVYPYLEHLSYAFKTNSSIFLLPSKWSYSTK